MGGARATKAHFSAILTIVVLLAATPAEALAEERNGPIVFFRHVFGHEPTHTGYEIFRVSRNGETPQRLTNNLFSDTDPALSPDGTKLLFVREGEDVYVMDSDGTNEEFIIKGRDTGPAPEWSPDGGSIVFVDTLGDISTLDLEAAKAEPVKVAERPGWSDGDYDWYASDPAWSPDGRRIAYWTKEDDESDLEIVNADGTGHRQMTLATLIQGLDWSPSGHRIVLAMRGVYLNGKTDPTDAWELYTINADAKRPKRSVRPITRNSWDGSTGRRAEVDPAWSPNGKKLIFSGHRHGSDLELIKVNAAHWKRPQARQITFNKVDDLQPSWGPALDRH